MTLHSEAVRSIAERISLLADGESCTGHPPTGPNLTRPISPPPRSSDWRETPASWAAGSESPGSRPASFLADNGRRLVVEPKEAIRIVQRVAAGRITEPALAAWFRETIQHEAAPDDSG